MDQEPEMGRFDPKGDHQEPREPFLPEDEMLESGHEPEAPYLASFPIPKEPLNKKKLKMFLTGLRQFVEQAHQMSRRDQHILAAHLQKVKGLMYDEKEFSDEMVRIFEKIGDHFNVFLIHSQPVDRENVIQAIQELESKL